MALKQVLVGYEEDEDGFPMPVYDYVWEDDFTSLFDTDIQSGNTVQDVYDGSNGVTDSGYMGPGSAGAGAGSDTIVSDPSDPSNVPTNSGSGFWSTLFDKVKTSVGYDDKKDFGTNLANFLGSKAGMTTIAGLGGLALGLADKRPAYGGGTAKAYAGPAQQLTRTIEQGRYGPVAKYAASGGTMYAYASGGPVAMEDGGFVMTKRAVDGAGGPRGIQQLVPGARPIQGPGNGTSDSIPAYIQGAQGRTPARVSNGEAYVPRQAVRQAGGSRRMYDLMNKLQRRA